jgi:hypothetical protein
LPSQYNIVGVAQIESLVELATEIWGAASTFLSMADDQMLNSSSKQLIYVVWRTSKKSDECVC